VTVLEDLAPAPKVEVRPRGIGRREAWQRRLPLLPALIYTVVVTQIPFVVTLWYSFQNYFWNTPAPAHFTGLSNYKTVFTNPAFRGALVRSVVMTATAVIIAMILGVLFAVLLDRKFLGRSIVRTLIITPFLVMPVAAALVWAVLDCVSTVFVERQHGSDRLRNARKIRKTYRFSKDWGMHEALTYFTMYSANFCCPVRTLREEIRPQRYRQRTPALAAGLTDHVWSLEEWVRLPGTDRHKLPPLSPKRSAT